MPKVAEFAGIAIYIYFRDHPPPHFHVRYQGHKASIEIGGSWRVLAGSLPAQVLRKAVQWAWESCSVRHGTRSKPRSEP